MKKVLFVANIYKHFIAFHMPYLQLLKNMGCEVHLAAGERSVDIEIADYQHNINFRRNPFNVINLQAYFELRKLMDTERFDLVCCHTSIASAIARLACISSRKHFGTKLLYTVHGFDFSNYSGFKQWLLFYPVEKYLSKYADGIVLINTEDYNLVKRKKFRNSDTFKINGIGLDTSRFTPDTTIKQKLRSDYGFGEDDFIMIYSARFVPVKSHEFIIDSFCEIVKISNSVKVIFLGDGPLLNNMKYKTNMLGLDKNIFFYGYRNDVSNFLNMCDCGVSASSTEGLGMNVAEAMYFRLPVVVTENSGHNELVINGMNGLMFKWGDEKAFVNNIRYLYLNERERYSMGNSGYNHVRNFLIDKCVNNMYNIYSRYL